MRILIIGSSGMLGHMLTYRLEEHGYEVSDLSRRHPLRKQSIQLDILDRNALTQFLGCHDYDIIINCAALLNQDCERAPAAAVLLNAWLPHFLEAYFCNSGTKIIQISTDAVFSACGERHAPTDLCNPDTFYGQTKLAGELHNTKDLTIRSAFWGPDWRPQGKGLMNWFLQCTGTVKGYQNVVFNGVTSLECAEFIAAAIKGNYTGIHQLAAQDDCAKGVLLAKIQAAFHMPYVKLMPDDMPVSMRCLQDTRPCPGRTFDQMVQELHAWVARHPNVYAHYQNTTDLNWQVSTCENNSNW